MVDGAAVLDVGRQAVEVLAARRLEIDDRHRAADVEVDVGEAGQVPADDPDPVVVGALDELGGEVGSRDVVGQVPPAGLEVQGLHAPVRHRLGGLGRVDGCVREDEVVEAHPGTEAPVRDEARRRRDGPGGHGGGLGGHRGGLGN